MTRSRFVLAVSAALLAGGCSGTQRSIREWFGASPTPAPAAARKQTYYSAVEGLVVYAQASGSSAVVGRLSLHQRVTRARVERGYAQITTEAGLVGWVDNAQLIWRLPAAGAETTAPAPSGAEEAPAREGAASDEPAGTESAPAVPPTPTTTPAAEAPPTQTAVPAAEPKGSNPAPSIFDPY